MDGKSPTYCTIPENESCKMCSLSNYGRDCANEKIQAEEYIDQESNN